MTDAMTLMTPGELRVAIGLKPSRFCELQRRGTFRFLEVKRPIGRKKYSRFLFEQLAAGHPVTTFARRTR